MLAILAAGGAIQATFFFGELGRFGSIGTGLCLAPAWLVHTFSIWSDPRAVVLQPVQSPQEADPGLGGSADLYPFSRAFLLRGC